MITSSGKFLFVRLQLIALAVLLLPFITMHANAAAIIGGSYVYAQQTNGNLVQYHVTAVDYQGTPAWRIAWDCEQVQAEHFVRRSDGAPLYAKRINHAMQRTVEIKYSLNADQPSIYSKRSKDEFLERKVWDKNLRDLGALPQMLQMLTDSGASHDAAFSIINYDDGKVYPLTASQKGFRNVNLEGDRVRCIIYEVKLDSWLSTFVGSTRIVIPQQTKNSAFVAYKGPGLDGGDKQWTLNLVGRDKAVAMLDQSGLTRQ